MSTLITTLFAEETDKQRSGNLPKLLVIVNGSTGILIGCRVQVHNCYITYQKPFTEEQEKSLYVVSSETKVGFTLMKQEQSAILQRTFRRKRDF